ARGRPGLSASARAARPVDGRRPARPTLARVGGGRGGPPLRNELDGLGLELVELELQARNSWAPRVFARVPVLAAITRLSRRGIRVVQARDAAPNVDDSDDDSAGPTSAVPAVSARATRSTVTAVGLVASRAAATLSLLTASPIAPIPAIPEHDPGIAEGDR